MTDSCLHTYNSRHHDCKTLGELHGLADAMRGELLSRIMLLERDSEDIDPEYEAARADGECPVCGAPGPGCTTCLAELRRDGAETP